jgi:FkbM family methyltransferase
MLDLAKIDSFFHSVTEFCKKIGVNRIPGSKIVHSMLYSMLISQIGVVDRADITKQHGFDLVAPPTMQPNVGPDEIYEEKVTNAIKAHTKSGDTVLDVGGYIGYHTLALRNVVGTEGEVITFEPHPDNAKLIKRTVRQNELENISVEQIAVSDTSGKTTLAAHPKASSMHSLLQIHEGTESITVETIILSEYLHQNSISQVDFAKIDVEGGEKDIICNTDSLDYIKKAVIELHPQFIGLEKSRDIVNKLNSKGEAIDVEGDPMTSNQIKSAKTTRIIWHNTSI